MSFHAEQFAELLVSLGEQNPSVEAISQETDAARWIIEFERDLVLLLELDEDHGTLNIEADLGRPPEERRLETCEALMMFTSLKHASEGMAMALSEPAGNYLLLGQSPALDMEGFDIPSAILKFADHALQWKDIVADGAQQGYAKGEMNTLAMLA